MNELINWLVSIININIFILYSTFKNCFLKALCNTSKHSNENLKNNIKNKKTEQEEKHWKEANNK